MARLALTDVTVEFPIFSSGARSLKKHLVGAGSGGRIGKDARDRTYVHALDHVTLDFAKGDRVGLIGHNGSGKTTLLRVLAGIYEPLGGTVTREGAIAALFDVALGMELEKTGFENILLRGLFLGLTRRQIQDKIDEIAEFTELGDYLSVPIRTYSSGMLVRLGFAVCTSFTPEILLMDEWLGVGDARFLERAKARLDSFVGRSAILVLATHSEELVRTLCNKAVLMHKGAVVAEGEVDAVYARYHAAG